MLQRAKMRYKRLQKIGICNTSNLRRKGKIYYNTVQWFTMRYKMLQKQHSPRTSLKVAQKLFISKVGDMPLKELLRICGKEKMKNKKTVRKKQRKKFHSNVTLYSASAKNILGI